MGSCYLQCGLSFYIGLISQLWELWDLYPGPHDIKVDNSGKEGRDLTNCANHADLFMYKSLQLFSVHGNIKEKLVSIVLSIPQRPGFAKLHDGYWRRC